MARQQDFLDLDDRQDKIDPSTIALFILVGLLTSLLVASAMSGYNTLKENILLTDRLNQCETREWQGQVDKGKKGIAAFSTTK